LGKAWTFPNPRWSAFQHAQALRPSLVSQSASLLLEC
jgi:hypothetical protein